MSTKLSELSGGDVIRVGGILYRLMYKQRNAWGCRKWVDDEWGMDYTWFLLTDEADEVVSQQPQRNKKARKESKADHQDPLQWKGTKK
jgi:hypothetical protein